MSFTYLWLLIIRTNDVFFYITIENNAKPTKFNEWAALNYNEIIKDVEELLVTKSCLNFMDIASNTSLTKSI